MRKQITLFTAALCVYLAIKTQSVTAVPTVDPTLIPFKKGELQQKLQANKENSHALILLLLRADEMSSSRVDPAFSHPNPNSYNTQALQALGKMHRRYPNNMKVLSAYCFALDIRIQGTHHQFTSYEEWSPEKEQQLQSMLKEIYKKSPKLWVPYAIEGYRKFYYGSNASSYQESGLELLKKSIQLAPTIPLIRSRYAVSCRYFAEWQRKDKSMFYGISIDQCEKALKLRPFFSYAALDLSRCYAYGWTRNLHADKEKAYATGQIFLSMLPSDYVFAEYEQIMLKEAGIEISLKK